MADSGSLGYQPDGDGSCGSVRSGASRRRKTGHRAVVAGGGANARSGADEYALPGVSGYRVRH